MQRTLGNRAVVQLLSRSAPVFPIQAKLTVGSASDQYEQEADRTAAQVMGRPAPETQQSGRAVSQGSLVDSMSPVQKQSNGAAMEASPALEGRLASNRGSGSPIPAGVRSGMEERFGADFSGVRLHTGTEAAELNQGLNAKAFTWGSDIYLGADAKAPGTKAGNHLLAHELTHTLQQGAGGRIQGWWPKGHRLVTELAFKQGGFFKLFSPEAAKFLVDRSPDIDFIQDQPITMVEGQKAAAPRLEMYEKLIKAGQDPEAKRMWKDNDLHMRRPEYMLSHGEAGLYKEPDAGGKNEAMSSRLLDKAVGLWKWSDYTTWGKSLEKLGDALHQAEDRGSHGEGNQFSGHDTRLNLWKWLKDHKRQPMPWEKLPSGAPGEGWEPDNFDVNQKGGVLGVGFAMGALSKFARLLNVRPARPVELPTGSTGKKAVPKKRSAKFAWFLPKIGSGDVLSHFKGSTGGGSKKLAQVLKDQMNKGDVEGAYGESTLEPGEAHVSEEYKAQGGALEKGMDFYEKGRSSLQAEQVTLTEIMTRAYVQFNKWGRVGSKFGRGLSREYREKATKKYLEDTSAKYEGEMKDKVIQAVQAAHRAVFGYPIPKHVV
jgi:hypothetical protein